MTTPAQAFRPPRRVTDVISTIAECSRVQLEEILSSCRQQRLVRPRHIAMLLARERFPNLSASQIAERFGRRDHTTVLHGVHRAAWRLRDPDPANDDLRALYARAKEILEHG